jgi:superfamily I DNA/RNA helicase
MGQFSPDKYQTQILKTFTQTPKNVIISAKAGSGKTTTLLYLMEYVTPGTQAVSMAFSKNIQLELASKIPKHIESMTIHSYGNGILRKNKIIKRTDKWKVGGIVSKGYSKRSTEFKEAVIKLVGLCKNTLEKNLRTLVEKYQVDLGDSTIEELEAIVPQVLAKDKKMSLDSGICDFDDMLWLPIELNLEVPKYEIIFVDEIQDLNSVQIELMIRATDNTGRIVGVGDVSQSVFAFRGANPDSIPILTERLAKTPRTCVTLPLSISYRCSTEVIKLAQTIVPDIEAAPTAVKGSTGSKTREELKVFFSNLTPEHLKTDDKSRKIMILCRVNAPLIEWQMLLKDLRLPYVFRSTMLASQLQDLVAKHSSYGSASLEETCRNLEKCVRQAQKYMKGMVLAAFADKISTLVGFINAAPPGLSLRDTYDHIDKAIESLFKPTPENKDGDKDSILISTIHGAKGLEARHVFIIRPDLIPHPLATKEVELTQEQHLHYVGITRAKINLCFVTGKEEN